MEEGVTVTARGVARGTVFPSTVLLGSNHGVLLMCYSCLFCDFEFQSLRGIAVAMITAAQTFFCEELPDHLFGGRGSAKPGNFKIVPGVVRNHAESCSVG
jgi:hypothetical protein